MKATACVLVAIVTAATQFAYAQQTPFSQDEPSYAFKRPILRVAVIGAGVGGLTAYRELREAGLSVHVFERDHVPGGNWHYTDEAPLDAPIPNLAPAVGDYVATLPPHGAIFPYTEIYEKGERQERWREHRAPKPVWESLRSNAPAPIQQIRELPWPVGTPWSLHNRQLQGYLRAFASFHGLNSNDNNPNISYNTRVELVEKHINVNGEEDGWDVVAKTLVDESDGKVKAIWRKEHFDAVVVATGRYNAPNMPNIPGAASLVQMFSKHVQHSRQYRRPEIFTNKTILIVGAATSGGEISRELIKYAKHIYQSVRPETSPFPQLPRADYLRRLPTNVTLLGEIRQFKAPPSSGTFDQTEIELSNGTTITGIDHIIFATGFRYSYPFLPKHHNASVALNDTAPAPGTATPPIVTDGTHLRALYLDAIYIPDPTLAFINANFGMQSFTHGEFVSLALAKIWTGKADLPAPAELWKRYWALYSQRKGYGRHFQFLGAAKTREVLRFYQGWLNDAAVKYGGKQIDGLSKDNDQINAVWTLARYSLNTAAVINNVTLSSAAMAPGDRLTYDSVGMTGTEEWAQDAIFNDYW